MSRQGDALGLGADGGGGLEAPAWLRVSLAGPAFLCAAASSLMAEIWPCQLLGGSGGFMAREEGLFYCLALSSSLSASTST